MSPVNEDRPFLISFLKPPDTDTAIIITRKLTAIHAVAILPLKRSLLAMKYDASTILKAGSDVLGQPASHSVSHARSTSEDISFQISHFPSCAKPARCS